MTAIGGTALTVPTLATRSSAAFGSETLEGVTIQVDPQVESELLEDIEEVADALPGVDMGTHACELYDDGDRWIVVHDEPVATGKTTVEGDLYGDSSLIDFRVAFADSVSTDTTGETVSLEDLRDDIDRYSETLVSVTDSFQQVAYRIELGDGTYTDQVVSGRFTGDNDLEALPPGQAAQWASMYLSSPEVGGDQESELDDRLGDNVPLVYGSGVNGYWTDGKTTVSGVIVDRAGTPTLHVSEQSVKGTAVDDVSAVTSGAHDGETVSLEADAAGIELSTKETLLAVAPCGQDMVTIGQACLPILGDTVLHAGVLYDEGPQDRSDVMLYVAISNEEQAVPVDRRHERLSVTGEVVTADSIDPALEDHRALLVYDIEGEGSLDEDIAEIVLTYRDEFQGLLEEQLATPQGEYVLDLPLEYVGDDGTVDTNGLRRGIDDWRSNEIGTQVLRDVIDHWRSGDSVTA